MTISTDRNAEMGVGAGVDTVHTVNPAKTICEKEFARSL